MSKRNEKLTPVNYFLEPGFIFIAKRPAIISVVLGSCVSVCIYDRKRRAGGMNHFKLPYIGDSRQATAVYGNVATLALIRMMVEEGSKKKNLEAQIFGGAYNRRVSQQNIGRENIMAARKILAKERVNIASEDIGGEIGRKIIFNTDSCEIAVLKVEKLRVGDWHPYISDR